MDIIRVNRSFLAVICGILLVPPSGYSQTAQLRDFGGPVENHWYTPFTHRYQPANIPPVDLSNSSRLESLIRGGNLYLSLQDAIALALENNLDIQVQRYGAQIARADLLRAEAGGPLRGVSTGVTQGPSSAATNQLNGGVSSGGGGGSGSSSGAGGTIITSTGTQLPNLDEVFSTSYQWTHLTNPNSNSFTSGTTNQIVNNGVFSAAIQRGFITGTTVNMNYGTSTLSSNNVRSDINPSKTGDLALQINQHLLQGFGIAVNNRNIRIARNDLKITDLTFKQQVINTVASVVNLYSDLINFTEDVKVKRQALALNQKLYNDNKKQVEIGTLAPIEIVRAEAEVARSQQDLTQSETNVLQQETIIKNALSKTGAGSPTLAEARVIPTDTLKIPDVEPVEPIQSLYERAVAQRPEINQTDLNIQNTKIGITGDKSQLLPSLDVFVNATNNALVGSPNQVPIPSILGNTFIRTAPDPNFVGGYGSLLSQIFGRHYPNYGAGFQLNIPLRNRSAQADLIRDELSLRQAELQQRSQLNQIRVDVQNALIGLRQARAQYQSAAKSRVLQEQTLDAEQKKYALGASTIFFVIQAQRDLSQAQAAEVTALSTYGHSRVALERATGDIIPDYNVVIDEAMKGKVSRAPDALPVLGQR